MKTINVSKTGNGNFGCLRLSLKEMRRYMPEIDPGSFKRATRRAERHELNQELREGVQDELAAAAQIKAEAKTYQTPQKSIAPLLFSDVFMKGPMIDEDGFNVRTASKKVIVIRKKDAFTRRVKEVVDVTVPLLKAA